MEELRFYVKYLTLAIAILGTLKYKDLKGTKAKYFLFSIWFGVIIEFIGPNTHKLFNYNSFPFFNSYTIIIFTFYLWWYRSIISSVKRKKIIMVFIVVNILFTIIDALFIQDPLHDLLTFAYALGAVFLVTTICYYFIEVFQSEKVLKVRSSIYFWISLGMLLFYVPFLPFFFAYTYLLIENEGFISIIVFLLNLIMMTCFAIGYLNAKKSAHEHLIDSK